MIDKAVLSLPGAKRTFAFLAVTMMLKAFLIAGQAWGLATAIVGLWHGEALEAQLGWLALFFLCFVARQAVLIGQDAYMERYACARSGELRQNLLETVFAKGASVVQAHGTGKVATMALEGVDQVETYIRLVLPKMAGVIVMPVVLLAFIFPIDWISGIIAFVAFPFIVLYMVMLGRAAQDEAAKRHATFVDMSNGFVDSLRGVDTLKLFGRGKEHAQRIYESSERFRDAAMKTLRVATLSSAVLDLFATFSLAAVAIMLGFRLVDGDILLFPALLVLVLVPEYFKPVREFAADYHASLDGKNALAAIRELADTTDEKSAFSSMSLDVDAVSWDASCVLEADDLSFSYPEATVLRNVSFAVRGFANVGIVGASGAGKSTLARMLAGFADPDEGSFSVNGDTMSSLAVPSWRKSVIYIPQTPYLFHATLRENVAFYRPQATDDEVNRAVEAVGLGSVVDELPDGLDTLVGEGARALSGGQAQRIALARALLDPARRILVFDEPTAHLDIETEWELKERMVPLMKDRLVFFATHRLHWMQEMDVVFVMEDGRIVEAGRPEELLSCGGALARLAQQAGGGDDDAV